MVSFELVFITISIPHRHSLTHGSLARVCCHEVLFEPKDFVENFFLDIKKVCSLNSNLSNLLQGTKHRCPQELKF